MTKASPEVDPFVGQVLSGRFEVVARLGVGGMGRVYRAVQRPLGREVALKVLNPRYDGTRDPGFERRFFLEASMTSKLKHPNTITVHDYGRTDEGIYFIAMEYLEGQTLQKVLLDERALLWPRALFIAGQIARSLREAHKLGLVHRDLKPANVMLVSGGTAGDTVKVLDFGLVKSFTPDKSKEEEELDQTDITQAGVLLGSPLYMAPEQVRGEADPRTDIYALGVLMFQAIAGKPPFTAKDSIDVIVKHLREAPPELTTMVPDVPLEVNALVMRCLAKDPAGRFQSMDELLDAMRQATSGQGLTGAFADPRIASSIISSRDVAKAVSNEVLAAAKPPPLPSAKVAARQSKQKLWLQVSALVALVLLAGFGAALSWNALFETEKPIKPVTTVVTPINKVRELSEVRFLIDSQPTGATVSRDGVIVGMTPFELTVRRENEQPVQLDLSFVLEGYEPGTVVAQGLDGVVVVTPTLNKKAVPIPVLEVIPKPEPSKEAEPPKPATKKQPPPKTPKPAEPNGYKDDPY